MRAERTCCCLRNNAELSRTTRPSMISGEIIASTLLEFGKLPSGYTSICHMTTSINNLMAFCFTLTTAMLFLDAAGYMSHVVAQELHGTIRHVLTVDRVET